MKALEYDLAALKSQVFDMGERAGLMIELAARGLKDEDQDVLQEVKRHEDTVNRMQMDIDAESIRLLTDHGPVGDDLRFLLMVPRISSELERIADQAVNMCEYLQLLIAAGRPASFPESPRLAKLVLEMLRTALQAFFHQDRQQAGQVLVKDDLVDALSSAVLQRCLREGHTDMACAVAEILYARALERIADQTTNICEAVVYIISGEDIRHPARQ